ncbi:hypothetical protein CP532_6057 [Ophiocordyceps camponoti-leonardi (nom. inval.)]|nr:hypothetical protein CP532_6057 [Ophiocordyceps camponoti-leonardi (nom. inval.)]
MAPNEYFECGTCGKAFPRGLQARNNHCSSTGHSWPRYECDVCHRYFRTEAACFQHMNDTSHWNRTFYDCAVCDDRFDSDSELTEHHHYEHNYCSDCERHFQSFNNLKMHLRSRQHVGTNMACPFCSRPFATATGVTHHLESGSCPRASGLNRDEIYRLVRSKDPHGYISNNLLEWTGSYGYEATERCYNGFAYECYLCNREFDRLGSLTQHLNSPIHQMALYHCPNPSCRQEFKSLAGIINHFESESCGVTRFDRIQNQVDGLLRGGRLLTL